MNMKMKSCVLLALGLAALPALAQPMNPRMTMPPPSTNAPPPDKEKLNTMIGSTFGRQLAQADLKDLLDYDAIVKAMKDYVDGKPDMTETELREVSRQLGEYMRGQRELKSIEDKKASQEFMTKNASAQGVNSFPDGLQYKVIKEGSGQHPNSNDVVNVKYKGTLIDGTEFDHNDSAKLSLMRVVPGWREALPKMAVGSEWELFVPPDLGYGERSPRTIPPNSVLIFDITLLGVEAAPAPHAPTSSLSQGANQVVSGEIIKVPSAEGLKRGEKIEVIKPGETNVVETGK